MARFFGQALAGRRFVPPMEWALVCLLIALSLAGNTMDLDRKARTAATGLIAGLYNHDRDDVLAVRGVPIPREVAVTVRVQAQAVRKP